MIQSNLVYNKCQWILQYTPKIKRCPRKRNYHLSLSLSLSLCLTLSPLFLLLLQCKFPLFLGDEGLLTFKQKNDYDTWMCNRLSPPNAIFLISWGKFLKIPHNVELGIYTCKSKECRLDYFASVTYCYLLTPLKWDDS